MWGEIKNSKATNIKESYCLGEACLIFEYGDTASRTVAFKTAADLRKTKSFLEEEKNNFLLERNENEIKIRCMEKNIILNLVNNTHAERLCAVLENYKK